MKISPLIQFYTSKPTLKNDKKQSVQCPVNSYSTKLSAENYSANFMPNFTSLKFTEGENNFCDTHFFRDYETLEKAAQILKRNFPSGTDILDFASSNGEEAISLYAILNNGKNAKYKILCFDKSQNIVDLANKGVYTVYNRCAEDRYLLYENPDSGTTKDIIKYFNNIMEETGKPAHQINDEFFISVLTNLCNLCDDDFKIKYYKIKDDYKNNFEFNVGDINDIENLYPEKQAGAILFRNAFYIPTHNLALNEYDVKVRTDINKQEIIDNIVDKVYEKLQPGGLFIMGDNEKDHVFLADEILTDAESLFIPSYFAVIYKYPPVYKALTRNNRFKPVHEKTINSAIGKMQIFTVWQKNK